MHPATIGPYQIQRELGRGGMGEVFLATDSRLDRQVAIKALPAHLAQDPDRLARFQREAKVLASLNHPNVGAIYGLEEANGHQYLILEFIEGETLADRLISGAIPVDESLSIARQIAEALEVAHEKGVVHRDLKPGNVMVTPEGVVKVLDFGLARTAEGAPSTTNSPAAPESPTLPVHSPTIPGAIMGTAGYMSPEQARGKPVDKRSDIFSFGCVLYEMLTGRGPFSGETVTDSLGAILHREPEWAFVPPATPPRVRELLRSCLAKDRRNRLHDIGDARLEIERAIAGHEWMPAVPQTPVASRNRLVLAVAAGAACVLAGVTGWKLAGALTEPAPAAPSQTFHVSTTVADKPAFNSLVGISPDARFLVYTAWPELHPDSVKPEGLLMVRRLDRDESTVIEGTEGALDAALSPDGRSIAFSCAKDRARSKLSLKVVALENGRPSGKPEMVCDLTQGAWPSLCWASDREIVFSPAWEPTVYAVSASGGEPRVVVREDIPKGIESWQNLRPLVAGKCVLATRWSFVGQKVTIKTELIDLTTGKRSLLLPDAGLAQFVADGRGKGTSGYLLATRSTLTSLVAVRFDLDTLRTIGEPVTVWSGSPLSAFYMAPSGTLTMATRSSDVSDRRLAWVDDRGQAQPIPGATRAYSNIVVSPDGGRVLVNLDNAGSAELTSDLWVQDLVRRTFTRIPAQGAVLGMTWSNDGQRIAYGLASDGAFSIWERRADGSGGPARMHAGPDTRTLLWPTTWSTDSTRLAFVQVDMSADNADTYLLEREGGSGQWIAKPYLKSPDNEDLPRFSPDGKWALIGSSQSGRNELYAQRFTGDGEADARAERVPISTSGANSSSSWWSPDGKEIRYLDTDSQIMSVQVSTEPAFTASEPKILYSIKDLKTRAITFAPDGRLMVVLQGQSEQTTTKIDLAVNFLGELRARVLQGK